MNNKIKLSILIAVILIFAMLMLLGRHLDGQSFVEEIPAETKAKATETTILAESEETTIPTTLPITEPTETEATTAPTEAAKPQKTPSNVTQSSSGGSGSNPKPTEATPPPTTQPPSAPQPEVPADGLQEEDNGMGWA